MKTKHKPVSCKCKTCKKMCASTPCLGTPEDIEKIIDAGHGDSIAPTLWAAAIMMGVTEEMIEMYQPKHVPHLGCIFFKDGLCQLHDAGLKPTEGKLANHNYAPFNPKTNLTWHVSKEWLNPKNKEIINRIKQKLEI